MYLDFSDTPNKDKDTSQSQDVDDRSNVQENSSDSIRRNSKGEAKTSRYHRPKPKDIPLKEMQLVATRRSSRISQLSKDNKVSDVSLINIYL